MIDGLRVLVVVAARGGSKGLPGKNIRPLGGRPLVAWSIQVARESAFVDRIIISSDSQDIINAAVAAGAEAPFVRPAALAGDDAEMEPVLLDALDRLPETYDLLVLMQPTSPLCVAADIDDSLRKCVDRGANSVVTVTELAKSPYRAFKLDEQEQLVRLLPPPKGGQRQELPISYAVNGAVYVVRVDHLREYGKLIDGETLGLVVPQERSVDIDTLLDFRLAELILAGA
ncbi:acylneuraminate cytidylyltransferase family protein [Magnetospira thiophila]